MAESKTKTSEQTKASAPKAAFYVFPNAGSTFDLEGKPYGWSAYEVVEAPDGALDHVGGGKTYGTRGAAEKAAAALKNKTAKK